jgi:hypothetical protein
VRIRLTNLGKRIERGMEIKLKCFKKLLLNLFQLQCVKKFENIITKTSYTFHCSNSCNRSPSWTPATAFANEGGGKDRKL